MYYVCTCLNTVCTVPWDSFHEIGVLAFHSVQHLCFGLENLSTRNQSLSKMLRSLKNDRNDSDVLTRASFRSD
jgi:hypothetical protein